MDIFACPNCSSQWKKVQLPRVTAIPVVVNFSSHGIKLTPHGIEPRALPYSRRVTARELSSRRAIESAAFPYWIPEVEMDPKGPQYRRNALQVRRIRKVTDFWTARNLWAFASLWNAANTAPHVRICRLLHFALTGITYYVTKKQAWGSGGGGLSGQLYISSFPWKRTCGRCSHAKSSSSLPGTEARIVCPNQTSWSSMHQRAE